MESPEAQRDVQGEMVAAVSPRSVFLTIGNRGCDALLVAATEGITRFVTGASGDPDMPDGGIPSALARLSAQCGLSLAVHDVEALIVRGRPLRVLAVGEPGPMEEEALHSIGRDGTARVMWPPDAPPHGSSGIPEWIRAIMAPFGRGAYDALIVLLPTGALPVWAAHLLTALQAPALLSDRRLITVASDTAIAAALPAGTVLLERNDALMRTLSDSLATILVRRLSRLLPADIGVSAYTQALAAGVALARRESSETLVYLDVSEGSSVVVARRSRVEIFHDADCDAAAGAATLLHRTGAEEVARWISFPIDAAALKSWAVRRVAAPGAILTDPEDRAIAGGFARSALRALVDKIDETFPPPVRYIVGPSLCGYEASFGAMPAVADISGMPGAAEVAADPDDLLPVVGYLASASPASARALLSHGALAPLGTLIVIPSSGPRKDAVVAALLDSTAGSSRTEVVRDGLTAIPARADGTVRIVRRGGREEAFAVRGGPSGLLIDTRARPLMRSEDTRGSRGKVSDRLRAPLIGAEEGYV